MFLQVDHWLPSLEQHLPVLLMTVTLIHLGDTM